eukprot:3146-Eustigmatos_ZCMA.PRE.1
MDPRPLPWAARAQAVHEGGSKDRGHGYLRTWCLNVMRARPCCYASCEDACVCGTELIDVIDM